MNRTDRLFAIVLELQRKGLQRAEDLAATFEVSKRTIYRDIQALSEVGVPIGAITHKGYFLEEDYFLPPLSFTTDEALMLALGGEFMAQNFDAQYRVAAYSAYRKIDAVLPGKLRDEVGYLKENISFFATNALEETQFEHLRQLRWAIMARSTVRLRYSKKLAEPNEPVSLIREVDPYSLARLANDWLFMGYCHLRQAIRVFRLARIDQLTVLENTFDRPVNFKPDWIKPNETRTTVVRVLFDAAVVRWILESRPYSVVAEEKTSDGLLMTLEVRQEREILQWLLSWGGHVRVLEPESLRTMIFKEVEQMLENYNQRRV